MYTYNRIPQYNNMYYTRGNNDDRFVGTGLIAPLLLGGVAGYAIGQNNNYNNGFRPMVFYPQPYPYYQYYPSYRPWYGYR